MGYERDVLIRARERHSAAVDAHKQNLARTRAKVYLQYPEIAALDNQIRLTMAEVMAHAFRYGEDPTEAVGRIREKNLSLQQRRDDLLLEAGYTPKDLDEGPLCRHCSDTGYVGEKMCRCLEAYCIEEQKKELTSLLKKDASFDDFLLDYYPDTVNPATGFSPRAQMELVYESCVNYACHFVPAKAKNLLLSGATGLGKTFLSACIAQEVVNRGCSVIYDTAIHVFSCMEKQKFGGTAEEELRTAQRVMECDLLILDDLGTEMNTAFIPTALYAIVNGRSLAGKPTIISTNFNLEQLSVRYGMPIASRLGGEYHILSFAGNDIRRIKKGM